MATTQQSGFAPAASPLASTIVQTPDDAIVAGFTSIPSQGDNMPAYHARPKQSDGPLPVVIVVQEIFGVHEHIRDICRRLALEGYLAIAPELYFREGDPNDFADIPTLLSGLVAKCLTRRCWPIRSCRQLGFPQRRRCSSFNDHRILLGWTYHRCMPRIIHSKSRSGVVRQTDGVKSLNSPETTC